MAIPLISCDSKTTDWLQERVTRMWGMRLEDSSIYEQMVSEVFIRVAGLIGEYSGRPVDLDHDSLICGDFACNQIALVDVDNEDAVLFTSPSKAAVHGIRAVIELRLEWNEETADSAIYGNLVQPFIDDSPDGWKISPHYQPVFSKHFNVHDQPREMANA